MLSGTDSDGDPLRFVLLSAPVHGTLSGSAPNLTYSPANNYTGSDSFSFSVNDGVVDSPPAAVSISIEAVNNPPVAQNMSVTTPQGTPIRILLSGSDPEGSHLEFSMVTLPVHGGLIGTPWHPTQGCLLSERRV